ncbi:MAG: LysR family transcriptional regulator [Beijerinckiaceae bacterium]
MSKTDVHTMLNLTHVRSFLMVVDSHGVRAAAKQLELSPSTIVEHIRQLEEHLAVPLLERANRSIQPSRYGARFLPYARALIRTATRARELVNEPRLRVASASNIGVYLLQPTIAAFQRQLGIEVELWIAPNRQVAERLERGEADIAAMEWWDNRPGFAATNWKREPLVLIVAPDHKWAQRDAVDPEDLSDEVLLGGEPGTGTGRVLMNQLGERADRLRIQSGFGSTEAVKKAVQAGLGASVVMRSSVTEELASGRLAAVPIKDVPLTKELKLVRPNDLPAASTAAIFVQYLMMDRADLLRQ